LATLDEFHETRACRGGEINVASEGCAAVSTAAGYAPEEMVPTVPITPTRPLRVAATSALAPGAITSMTGTSSCSRSASAAAAVAVLHAMITADALKSFTKEVASSTAWERTSSRGFDPYG
jgi:hypothetical protein